MGPQLAIPVCACAMPQAKRFNRAQLRMAPSGKTSGRPSLKIFARHAMKTSFNMTVVPSSLLKKGTGTTRVRQYWWKSSRSLRASPLFQQAASASHGLRSCLLARFRRAAAVGLLLAIGASAAFSADWRQFRGNDRNGIVSATDSAASAAPPLHWSTTENVAWKAAATRSRYIEPDHRRRSRVRHLFQRPSAGSTARSG